MTKFVEAVCRNEQDKVKSHLYKEVAELVPVEELSSYAVDAVRDGKVEVTNLYPMCGYGWNRNDGDSFSIFRGHRSRRGTCKTCLNNIEKNKEPVKNGWPHKTKWI